MDKNKFCHKCGKVKVEKKGQKLCDECLCESYSAETNPKRRNALYAMCYKRGILPPKLCGCGAVLEHRSQKKCTDCLLRELRELLKSGEKRNSKKMKLLISPLRNRGIDYGEAVRLAWRGKT